MAEKILIDKEALHKEIYNNTKYGRYGTFMDGSSVSFTSNEVHKLIDDAPTIDAVAVTRCRECKFHNHEYCVDPDDLYCLRKDCYMTRNDYCSYGERRSE